MAKAAKQKGELLFYKFKNIDKLGLFTETYQVPSYIKNNLKDTLRAYQEESLRYLHYAQHNPNANSLYKHLLFNMATGAGKTMVMAATILYMYKEYGYQNFIFFVHTDAIIQKTKENLLNGLSSKYLFNSSIEIEGEQIHIEAVETFPSIPNKNTIYLKLSTIHKIHDELNHYKENSVTYDDLKEIPLVLLGDEAHHFNAETKAKGKAKNSPENEELTWERTIDKLLALQPKNRLFEFTATINLDNKEIYQKYKDKIIYQYDLKQFMNDGYSKRVMLLEANQNDNDKMLDAVLLSQYRKLIAIDNNITGFKPVVLFKSNQIATSKAKQEEFIQIIDSLTPEKITHYLANKRTQLISATSIWHKVIARYTKDDLITIIDMIKDDFNEMNLLNVNKTDLMEEQPVLLNTLEQIDNPIRAVFAVAKVNEGWDVLNLYDIVRISEKASSTKTNTDSEAQLIGRGARYFPFIYKDERSYTRRFDISNHDLSILEQLHYHTINEPSYIRVLHASLEQADIIAQSDGNGIIEHAKLKEKFKESNTYRYGKLYYNKVEEITGEKRSWQSYSLETHFEEEYKIVNETFLTALNDDDSSVLYKLESLQLDKRFFFKAMARQNFYTFNNLQHYFPKLTSMDEFISSDNYLGKIKIDIKLPQSLNIDNLTSKEKLNFLENVLSKIADNICRNYRKYKGTYEFISQPLKDVITDYSLYIDPTIIVNQRITTESSTGKTWYVFDKMIVNQLEHRLIKLLDKFMSKLKVKYDDIYLIRNDEKSTRFKLTEFNGVRGFMPDFILMMKSKNDGAYYQVFLEPKGDDRLLDDKWKQDMLEVINPENIILLDADEDIRLIGIKFFADSQRDIFINDFSSKLYDGEPLEDTSLI
ncbi:restriction endonuclease [Gilliamella apicola]|uniref:Restriction endonuclease n=2 Tax=Gilliamella apicola TaxID=1196095 RepID=A0A556RKC7_9GAMM|nr:DEAD/DEAH box helicase family protein [Gilliamella apicola]TSJ89305.1 restriction endonuclease [Gilliamella apicola]